MGNKECVDKVRGQHVRVPVIVTLTIVSRKATPSIRAMKLNLFGLIIISCTT